jgi:hypothetical protein
MSLCELVLQMMWKGKVTVDCYTDLLLQHLPAKTQAGHAERRIAGKLAEFRTQEFPNKIWECHPLNVRIFTSLQTSAKLGLLRFSV